MEYFRNENIKYKLIFRATRDGGNSTIFHQKCYGIPKTITLVKTVKGLIFGGYIDKEWDSNFGWISGDENCFIFSFDLKKIYKPIKGEPKYSFDSNYGPNFSEFGIGKNLFEKSSLNVQTKQNANKYFIEFNSDYEINGGEQEFQVKELEIFQIKI